MINAIPHSPTSTPQTPNTNGSMGSGPMGAAMPSTPAASAGMPPFGTVNMSTRPSVAPTNTAPTSPSIPMGPANGPSMPSPSSTMPKPPMPGNPSSPAQTSPVGPPPPPRLNPVQHSAPPSQGKKTGLKWAVAAVFLVFLTFGGGVAYYLAQNQQDDRSQAAPQTTADGVCSVSFNVATPSANIACVKETFQDTFSNSAGTYSFTTAEDEFKPGDVVVFRVNSTNNGPLPVEISLSDTLTGLSTSPGFTFMDSTCGTNAYNSTTKVLTCPGTSVAASQSATTAFRIKLADNAPSGTYQNTATITSGSMSQSCAVTISVTQPPAPGCGENCGGAAGQCPGSQTCSNGKCVLSQCLETGMNCDTNKCAVLPSACGGTCSSNSHCPQGHICSSNKCILEVCQDSSANCTADKCRLTACGSTCSSNSDCPSSLVCSNNRCVLEACLSGQTCTSDRCSVTTITKTTGCGTSCSTNSDCVFEHICVQTAQGGACRLATNPTSANCQPPVTLTTPTPAATPQPEKPQELPKAGSEGAMTVVGIGAGLLLIGVLFALAVL